ncbi:hypothetical protein NW762_013611 [Fusarium torreyae]|uniref:BZIP domain-containing protein n=1 Tax=Fusarium torreyae TaxID=1237075 RepID=A0A9W8RNN6_9HYPO|nr:hypothetical protein NW762_013611 [Fusarium torreyae]
MGTVYPAFPYAAHHPLSDGTQTHDTYPPTPDMNLMNQDPNAMNPYGALPQGHRGQWWSPESTCFPGPSPMAAPDAYTPEELQYNNNYTYEPEPSRQWSSPATSGQSYVIPSPSTEPTSQDISTRESESRRGSSAAQPDKRKRKRGTNQSTTTKATRRGSTKKPIKTEKSAPEKPKTRGSTAKPIPQTQQSPSPDPDEEPDQYSKKVQERNRVASNKFRVKKREDAKKLRANEEDMERVNRDLSSCVSDLTLQVYELKMRLLQHTDCECVLIQDYIANEAHRYIHDLGEGKHTLATPPLHPLHHGF